MKVVFRVDSSVCMGSGHLIRCLTLAEALHERGVQLHFICRNHKGNLINLLRQKAFHVTVIPAFIRTETSGSADSTICSCASQQQDAKESINALNKEMPDWLVVDHYSLGIEWEQQIRPHVKQLIVLDDFPNRRHDCDFLLDQNYSPDGAQLYPQFVPETCKLLLGPHYTLLRKEFRLIRQQLKPRNHQVKRVLVFFTAGNDQGETLKAMKGVELFGQAKRVDVVVGQSNPDNPEIIKKCRELNWEYHCQVNYMPKLIAEADLVIGGGGSSNWERCALGLPALVTILAENQAPIAHALDQAGIIDNLGWNTGLQPSDYEKALKNINSQHLAEMSEKAFRLVDANGAERVAAMLFSNQLPTK
ncbi:MAG: UDP-2,4-diacetamido-2,4,6-trideoxy-beta-L-altropyranose hydrolase [Chlorobium sp.]|nr:MAG: UDP-2,4-diacetamido-2,4,6-trideoxy-beta-L-altropyranose hydrolase [Chlorobium sp.]